MRPWLGLHPQSGLKMPLPARRLRAATPPRQRRTSFDDGWSFAKGDIPDAQSPQFTGGNWTPVILPHDWSIAGPFSETEPCGSEGAYLPTGIGWYRKSFQLPRSDAGRRILLQFDGVYQCSDVWINGQHLGTRPYGFTTFYYDLTPHLHFGSEPNLVAVRVDNSHQPNLRWYSGSGINRHTWLIDTGPVYIEQWGTGVTTPQITAQSCHRRSLHARAQYADAIRILHAEDRSPRPEWRRCAVDGYRRGDPRRRRPSLCAAHRRAPAQALVAHYADALFRASGAAPPK